MPCLMMTGTGFPARDTERTTRQLGFHGFTWLFFWPKFVADYRPGYGLWQVEMAYPW